MTSSLHHTTLTCICGSHSKLVFTGNDFWKCPVKRITRVFNAVLPEDHMHPVLTICLVPLHTDTNDSMNLMIMLCSVHGGLFKVQFSIEKYFYEIVPQFLDALCCRSVNLCPSLFRRVCFSEILLYTQPCKGPVVSQP